MPPLGFLMTRNTGRSSDLEPGLIACRQLEWPGITDVQLEVQLELGSQVSRQILGPLVVVRDWARAVTVTTSLTHWPCSDSDFPSLPGCRVKCRGGLKGPGSSSCSLGACSESFSARPGGGPPASTSKASVSVACHWQIVTVPHYGDRDTETEVTRAPASR